MLLETHLDWKPKNMEPRKLAYLINFSLKWLICPLILFRGLTF